MQISEVYLGLGQDAFAQLIRGISIGKLKTYQIYEGFKVRAHLTKVNTESLRKAVPKLWERISAGDEDFAKDLAQAILVSHLDMIAAVLDFLGVPHEKDSSPRTWSQTVFHGRLGRAGAGEVSRRISGADSAFLYQSPALGAAGGDGFVPAGLAEHRLSSVHCVLENVRTMTVSVRNPQLKFRKDTAMPMEVLSLYADPIWPFAGRACRWSGPGVSGFYAPAIVLGHNTHRVMWNLLDCQVANSERCLT